MAFGDSVAGTGAGALAASVFAGAAPRLGVADEEDCPPADEALPASPSTQAVSSAANGSPAASGAPDLPASGRGVAILATADNALGTMVDPLQHAPPHGIAKAAPIA